MTMNEVTGPQNPQESHTHVDTCDCCGMLWAWPTTAKKLTAVRDWECNPQAGGCGEVNN